MPASSPCPQVLRGPLPSHSSSRRALWLLRASRHVAACRILVTLEGSMSWSLSNSPQQMIHHPIDKQPLTDRCSESARATRIWHFRSQMSSSGESPEDPTQHLAEKSGCHAALGSPAKRCHTRSPRQPARSSARWPGTGPGTAALGWARFSVAALLNVLITNRCWFWVPRHQCHLRRAVG